MIAELKGGGTVAFDLGKNESIQAKPKKKRSTQCLAYKLGLKT